MTKTPNALVTLSGHIYADYSVADQIMKVIHPFVVSEDILADEDSVDYQIKGLPVAKMDLLRQKYPLGLMGASTYVDRDRDLFISWETMGWGMTHDIEAVKDKG